MCVADHRVCPVEDAARLSCLAGVRYREGIHPVVSVSEATVIGRKYSTEKSADFVNGVLGGIINK